MKNKILILGVVVVAAIFSYKYWDSKQENIFVSRNQFSKAMEFIKVAKPTPPESAIFYAKVAEDIYNKKQVNFSDEYFTNVLDTVKKDEEALPNITLKAGNTWNEYWIGQDPFSPKISQYPRFALQDFNYAVPQPTKFKSPEFYKALDVVKQSAANRTAEQSALINFYGGVPGTEQPAGIWQNILWSNTKMNKDLNDEKYAKIQMVLAQSLADSFMECWKVKYTYQTKRPNMTDPEISLAMPNPNFSSYTSGHSTVSFTAANILSHFFPTKKDVFIKNATDAKNSRLWAGIHFPYDNDEGQKLGEEVAKNIISNL